MGFCCFAHIFILFLFTLVRLQFLLNYKFVTLHACMVPVKYFKLMVLNRFHI